MSTWFRLEHCTLPTSSFDKKDQLKPKYLTTLYTPETLARTVLMELFLQIEASSPSTLVKPPEQSINPTQAVLDLFSNDKKEQVHERFDELVLLAQQVLPQRLKTSEKNQPHKKITPEEYQEIRQAIIDFYILAQPHRDPDSVPTILNTEKKLSGRLSTPIYHTSRSTDPTKSDTTRMWCSDINGAVPQEKHQSYIASDELTSLNIPDTSVRWMQIEEGLLDHTLIASELLLQVLLKSENTFTSGEKAIENFDPYEWAIKMLLHDVGRLITHDRYGHAICTDAMLEEAGIDKRFYEHPDITHLFSVEYPPSISEALESGDIFPIDLLFHFVDVMGKNTLNTKKDREDAHTYDPKIMRVTNIPERIQQRASHYATSERLLSNKPLKSNFRYGPTERNIMSQIAVWVQSREGLSMSVEDWENIVSNVERAIFIQRQQLGLQPPI